MQKNMDGYLSNFDKEHTAYFHLLDSRKCNLSQQKQISDCLRMVVGMRRDVMKRVMRKFGVVMHMFTILTMVMVS